MLVVLVFEHVRHLILCKGVIPTIIVHGRTIFVPAMQTQFLHIKTVLLWGKFGAGPNHPILVWYADI
jgi:hypothetical protein